MLLPFSPLFRLGSENHTKCFRWRHTYRNAVVSPESRFAQPRSPGHWSIRPMTYNTLQHGENAFSLNVFPCIFPFFSGLKNDKYASGESTWSGRTAIGRTDLRAKRPDTHLPRSLTTVPHNNYKITFSSKA